MLSWDQRMMKMQELGDLFLYLHAPFDWRVYHKGVLIIDSKGEDELVPEGHGCNPYEAADNHWRQLTAGQPFLRVNDKVVVWGQTKWTDVPEVVITL